MRLDIWNVTRLLLGPALGLVLVAAVHVDTASAQAAPATDVPDTEPEPEPVLLRSATTCGNNYPTCGNDNLCPPGYPTCIDAAGGCYCHGTGVPPKEPQEPQPLAQ